MKKHRNVKLKRWHWVMLFFVAISLVYISVRPTNNANWALDQQILPSAEVKGSLVTVHNVRDFTYRSETDYTTHYYDKTYDSKKIKTVDYIVEPFSNFGGAAHTFLTFGFDDNSHVSISIEIRKKKGQVFSPYKSLFKQYEIMYVVADENDAIKLRTNYRHDLVYMYPMRIDKEHSEKLFLSMIRRVNSLKDKPEFYNLLTNTCTTNIVSHVNEIAPKEIPWSYKVLLPGYSDTFAYDLGVIDTNLSFEETRAKFLINEKALKYGNDADFSEKIRE